MVGEKLNIIQYLEKEWIAMNHPKYHKYFRDWVVNITDNQTLYFKKEMKLN